MNFSIFLFICCTQRFPLCYLIREIVQYFLHIFLYVDGNKKSMGLVRR